MLRRRLTEGHPSVPRLFAGLSLCAFMTALAPEGHGAVHDDDPKILDRKPAVAGTGYRRALLPRGSAATPPTSQLLGPGGFDTEKIQLQSWLTLSDLGQPSSTGNDCWGYTSPSGREYALMCVSTAMVVVEVTDPGSPQVIGTIPGPSSLWRDVKSYADRAYVVTEGGGGIQVVDLSNVDAGVVTLEAQVTGQGTDDTHNVAIDEDSGFLYRCGGGSNVGLRIYSLQNPGAPQFVGSWLDRYVHDVQVVTMTSGPFSGRQIAYCCSGFGNGGQDTGLTILDVTDKQNITVLSQLAYPGRAYSHQGWLSADRTIFYLGDELDEDDTVDVTTTRIFDVSDPANASYIGAFDNDEAAVGHNMYEAGGYLFQANYTSGLRLFDIESDALDPAEVAFFDTAPNSTAATFNGLWSVYPYFPSGTVIGSDLERGLFVWSVEALRIEAPEALLIDPAGETLTATVRGFTASSLDRASVRLLYDIGAGQVEVPMVAAAGSDDFSADFPAFACGTVVTWTVAATTSNGETTILDERTSGVGTEETVVVTFDMEFDASWTSGAPGDTATTGLWTRGDPLGTAAQPEDDVSATGAACWFTGQGSTGGGIGENDVDGGGTTLLSPVLDLSGTTVPVLSYSRWYSNDQGNNPGADVFVVDLSRDGGATWTRLETVGPTGPGTSGGWVQVSHDLAALGPVTGLMRVRFIAEDAGGGSIVEAAIDEFEVRDVVCTGLGEAGTSYCDATANSTAATGIISSTGSASIAQNDLVLEAANLPPNQFGFFVVSTTEGFIANPGGSSGNLCIAGDIGRYSGQIQSSGPAGVIGLAVDWNAMPQPSALVSAAVGETWHFQCWHRDVNIVQTSNFTRGYRVVTE